MRIFVTGASGWIGSAVTAELIDAGHEVVGLARSDASAAAITAAGATLHRGSLDDLEGLRAAAEASDGVVHMAFQHDIAFSGGFEAAATGDRRAVETFGDALAGSDRPLVVASGTLGLVIGQLATEEDGHGPMGDFHGPGPRIRRDTAEFVLSLASRGVRSSVMRFPPTVHGDGDHGFMASIVGIARAKGVSAYVGDGANRWPAVHRFDAGHLCRLAVENAPAGSTLHAVADEGVPVRPSPGSSGGVDPRVGRSRALHVAWRVHRPGQPRLKRDHAQAVRVGADAPGPDRGPRARPLLQKRVLAAELGAPIDRDVAGEQAATPSDS
jgi:nucleoside-diphosphate-sugar epimerase